MDAEHIAKTRAKDALIVKQASAAVGGGYEGNGAAVWVIEAVGVSRSRNGKGLADLLSSTWGRHRPALTGELAGEVATIVVPLCALPFESPRNIHNGLERGTLNVFIGLVFSGPDAQLDENRVGEFLPGCTIHKFHNDLHAGWNHYLQRLSYWKVEVLLPEQIVYAMMSRRGREFQPIGRMRGIKSWDAKEHTRYLHATKGKPIRVAFYAESALKHPERIIEHGREILDSHSSDDAERPIPQEECVRILLTLELQMRSYKTMLDKTTQDLLKRNTEAYESATNAVKAEQYESRQLRKEAARLSKQIASLEQALKRLRAGTEAGPRPVKGPSGVQ